MLAHIELRGIFGSQPAVMAPAEGPQVVEREQQVALRRIVLWITLASTPSAKSVTKAKPVNCELSLLLRMSSMKLWPSEVFAQCTRERLAISPSAAVRSSLHQLSPP